VTTRSDAVTAPGGFGPDVCKPFAAVPERRYSLVRRTVRRVRFNNGQGFDMPEGQVLCVETRVMGPGLYDPFRCRACKHRVAISGGRELRAQITRGSNSRSDPPGLGRASPVGR